MRDMTKEPTPERPSGSKPKRKTVPDFRKMKSEGRKITMLTAYDYPLAQLLDEAGVDGILVGDSLSVVVQGHENTLHVTLDEIIYHAEIVGRAVEQAMVIVDMPFPTYRLGVYRAIENAARILKETRSQAVKLECGAEQAEIISGLVGAGIPVMAHVGLSPQAVHQLGGYRVQRDEQQLLDDALTAEKSGAFAVLMECIPSEVAGKITAALSVPTIGIGAGVQCDGQVLVTHDILGLTSGYVPRFARKYANLAETIRQAADAFCDDVRQGRFPEGIESYK
jgi:3-methyl-2-oxobutanoate hydroxymethyltransferase